LEQDSLTVIEAKYQLEDEKSVGWTGAAQLLNKTVRSDQGFRTILQALRGMALIQEKQ